MNSLAQEEKPTKYETKTFPYQTRCHRTLEVMEH